MSRSLEFQIHRHQRVGSTSELASRKAREGAPEGTLVVADEQTAGRGRAGRSWHSPPGAGLYMSVILRPSLPTSHVPRMTVLAAVAVARSIRNLTGLEAMIKWPNDIWIGDRKVAGILAEGSGGVAGAQGWVVLGIGVNVGPLSFPPPIDQTATCLSDELGRPVSAGSVMDAVLGHLSAMYTGWRDSGWSPEGWAPILSEYRAICMTLGREVTVKSPGDSYSAVAEGIDDDGGLVVRVSGGEARTVRAQDVSIGQGEAQPGMRSGAGGLPSA